MRRSVFEWDAGETEGIETGVVRLYEGGDVTWTCDLSTDVGLVRLELGDDTENSGVKPEGTNFSDEEIQTYLDREGSVMGAVAALCENLSNRYTTVVNVSVGSRRESLGAIGKQWAIRAATIRKLYGGRGREATAGSMIKRDGYNDDDTPSDQMTGAPGSDYDRRKWVYIKP